MITKTQEEVKSEFNELFGHPFAGGEEPNHGKKVVSFEISDVQFKLLADVLRQRDAAMRTLVPTSDPAIEKSDEELVVQVYEMGLRRTLRTLTDTTQMLDEAIAFLEHEE